MSLYRRHAQGAPVKGDFSLTVDNIDQYLGYAMDMNDEILWLNHLADLHHKLENIATLDDELYTEEYLKRRLAVLESKRDMSEDLRKIQSIKSRLTDLNKEIGMVKPLVFDKEEGKKPEHHAKMSELDDQRKHLEEEINNFYGQKYPNLKQNLPKVYYMIIDGCDITTVQSCFMQMKQVLQGKKTTEQAAGALMDESSAKYNLPSTIWDPIRINTRGSKGSKSKGSKGSKSKGG